MIVIEEKSLCSLQIDIRKCEYRDENGVCLNQDSKCGFKKAATNILKKDQYVRVQRWYEELGQNRTKKR